MAQRAKAASQMLALASTEQKNRWLLAAAAALETRAGEILEANAKDIAAAPG
jgi:glutamate-5-semialdehyde dehydrogenase